jgi:L-fucose mutarotase/ribose pyranase (RbsD/FucU family)
MKKQLERNPTRDVDARHPEIHEVLPELPADVTIPDDISGLTHPDTEGRRPASGVRWMRWVAAMIFVAAGAVVLGLLLSSDDTSTPTFDGYTRAEINRAAVLQDLSTIPTLDGYTRAEINRAAVLQDLSTIPTLDGYTRAEINRAAVLQDLSTIPTLDGYTRAEINRATVLQDLSTIPTLDGYTRAEINRMEVLRDLSN